MKNYLDHSDKVKYVDGLLAHSQDWQWFIDLLQESFEIHELSSWTEYEASNRPIRDVFSYFVKVLEVSDKNWQFSKPEFLEVWEIARFYIGGQEIEECSTKVTTICGKLTLFCIWITKIGNIGCTSDSKYIFDIRILNQKNYYQLIDLENYLINEDVIVEFAKSIGATDLEKPLKCLEDNLARVEHPYDTSFFTKNEAKLLHYNAINFQHITAELYASWQERYLLDMVKVSLSNRKLQPAFVSNSGSVPDTSLWTADLLDSMKRYFGHKCADFLIDTILFVLHDRDLPEETVQTHLKLLTEALDEQEEMYKIFSSSSFEIISMLFEKRKLKGLPDDTYLRKLLNSIHSISDAQRIIRLKKNYYPISKEQAQLVNEYYQTKYRRIQAVSQAHELNGYLSDEDNANAIDGKHFAIVHDKFDSCVTKDDGLLAATIFYKYMIFLIKVNATNQNVDKRQVNLEMIRVQRLWQNQYFSMQIAGMHTFSQEISIPTAEVEKFNEQVLANPILFAQNCIPCTTEKLIDIMQCTSEHPLVHMVSRIAISPVFPDGGVKINLARHDIDELLAKQVQAILDESGYKFMNILKPETYILDIHDRYRKYTEMMVSFFHSTEQLYSLVQSETDIGLLPYSPEHSLAMLTQLFPILELKIREFSSLFGIFPFKKNLDEFMQHNDPSSLLREILLRIYTEQGSFENVPDLLFVYNIMYNSNSMNIRNDCIHGRHYLSGSSLDTALTATLFAIYMVNFRINTIEANVSDILTID